MGPLLAGTEELSTGGISDPSTLSLPHTPGEEMGTQTDTAAPLLFSSPPVLALRLL